MSDKKVMKTMDGNEACATVAYHFTDVAGIYPITPSSPMSEKVDEWSAAGKKNMFGQPVRLVEMQSEAGAAGALHGVAEAGALATTFTSSQGLLLMIPNLYIMAGHRMPAVFHVAARSVAQHANNIFGDHQDVMSCRTTGVTMMSTGSVQEVMDLAAVAHLTTIKTRVPFIHFHDGFRTSHEIQKIEVIDLDKAEKLLDRQALEDYHAIAMNPEHPVMRTTVQGPDVYYQSQEANNGAYDSIPAVVEGYMQGINEITGRDYHIFNYYGAEDADRVMVMMGSACECAREVVDYLCAKGEKVGLMQIHLFRPFDMEYFLNALPRTVKKIAAMDRSKEPGAIAGAVYLDVCAAFANRSDAPEIYGGRYGLASKDVTPAQLKAVFDNMKDESGKHLFTIGVNDDVTHLSLDVHEPLITESADTVSCKFWGLGSDGTVGANKNSAKIIGDYAGMYTQAYFEYDSKKSYGITKSHLRFSKSPIRSTYLIKAADFLACHSQSYITRYDMIHEIKDGGTFLLNTSWTEEELAEKLPGDVKQYIARHNVQFYIVDANRLARELGLGNHANMILQAAFFKLSGVMPVEDAVRHMKEAVQKTYAKKGEKVVNMNMAAVDAGINSPVKVNVPADWANAADDRTVDESLPDVVKNIVVPCNRQRGDDLPVSAFLPYQDGTYPLGTSKYDKRGIAAFLPQWDSNKCLQCNQCTFVCPHAAIRAYLVDEEEAAAAPAAEAPGGPGTGRPGGSRGTGPGSTGPRTAAHRRSGAAAHGRPRAAAHGRTGATGRCRPPGRTGMPSPEHGIVHRPAYHHRAAAIPAIPQAIQQDPHHKDAHYQQHHSRHRAGVIALPRTVILIIGIAAAALLTAQRLGIEHIRLPEEGQRRCVVVPLIVGSLHSALQARLIGVRHGVQHVIAQRHIVVAVLYQQQQHIIAAQPPPGAKLRRRLLIGPAVQRVQRRHGDDGPIVAVPALVILPQGGLRFVRQQVGVVPQPVAVGYLRQVGGLFADAVDAGAQNGQHQHHQRKATFLIKFHGSLPSRRSRISQLNHAAPAASASVRPRCGPAGPRPPCAWRRPPAGCGPPRPETR